QEAALREIEEGELHQRTRWQAVEQLLLVETPPVEIALEKGGERAERLTVRAVAENLLRLEAAVAVVARDPLTDSRAERKVVEIAGDVGDGAVRDGDRVD